MKTTPKPAPRLADIPGLAAAADIEPLLRLADIPRVMACSLRTIERARAAGRFPKADVIVGRRSPRWKPETLRAWIERGGAS